MLLPKCTKNSTLIVPNITITRFWSKIEKTSTCWNWIACTDKDGYGQFIYKKQFKAHRFSYELLKGKIPSGLTLDHLCKNRKCVNPDHLEAVSSAENLKRGISHNRNKTHCIHGHPFDIKNTHYRENGKRQCRMCDRIYARIKRNKIRMLVK